jgi:hypothetical protein
MYFIINLLENTILLVGSLINHRSLKTEFIVGLESFEPEPLNAIIPAGRWILVNSYLITCFHLSVNWFKSWSRAWPFALIGIAAGYRIISILCDDHMSQLQAVPLHKGPIPSDISRYIGMLHPLYIVVSSSPASSRHALKPSKWSIGSCIFVMTTCFYHNQTVLNIVQARPFARPTLTLEKNTIHPAWRGIGESLMSYVPESSMMACQKTLASSDPANHCLSTITQWH